MVHRTPVKVIVNTPLRFFQRPFTDRPWLLASVFEGDTWIGRYVFCRVQMREGWRRPARCP